MCVCSSWFLKKDEKKVKEIRSVGIYRCFFVLFFCIALFFLSPSLSLSFFSFHFSFFSFHFSSFCLVLWLMLFMSAFSSPPPPSFVVSCHFGYYLGFSIFLPKYFCPFSFFFVFLALINAISKFSLHIGKAQLVCLTIWLWHCAWYLALEGFMEQVLQFPVHFAGQNLLCNLLITSKLVCVVLLFDWRCLFVCLHLFCFFGGGWGCNEIDLEGSWIVSCMLILCGVCCACPAVRGCILCYGGGGKEKRRKKRFI